MVSRSEIPMVTGAINGQTVTVPAATPILEAARMAGIDVPNLCFQPKLRAWGSCRICTVEVLGKRGGLYESCATPLTEGMEVLTHSEACQNARQFVLQMYLIDHALDCPTCDKSGECYLQDNTYLSNVTANPYRRPKFTHSYTHFSDLIDYKADRCIMCNRCTRVCDEVIGVTAIEAAHRSLEATISPAFGDDLSSTLCTSCGMCIAVCPVGALTDRHFAHHPWELETTETICGFCDVGCTINIEATKGVVRRATHLWERGVNHGYTCYFGRWGHEIVQSPGRTHYPKVRDEQNRTYEVTWDDAISSVAKSLSHYQGGEFAMLVATDSTNEEVYALQQFNRAVMNSNNIDRLVSSSQAAVEEGVTASLGRDVANTNNLQELFTDVKCGFVIGPDIGKTAPVASYWFYHARIYREAKLVVISQDDYPLCWRADLWLKPNDGTTGVLLQGIARQIIEMDLASIVETESKDFKSWRQSLAPYDLDQVAKLTGVSSEHIKQAAILYATGGAGAGKASDTGYPPSLIYQTLAHQDDFASTSYGDVREISIACNNLALLTGNLGRAGGGVASPRGGANSQGASDLGARPGELPGGLDVSVDSSRQIFESAWLKHWSVASSHGNGFDAVRHLPGIAGIGLADLAGAIDNGDVKSMIIEDPVAWREKPLDAALLAALEKLEFLVVISSFESPLSSIAHVVLPKAMSLEKDGTYTSFDRTVQRVRAAVPPIGEAKSSLEIAVLLSNSLGYHMPYRHAAEVMDEISTLVPDYAGVNYARLERGGLNVPVASFAEPGMPVLGTEAGPGNLIAHLLSSAAS